MPSRRSSTRHLQMNPAKNSLAALDWFYPPAWAASPALPLLLLLHLLVLLRLLLALWAAVVT